VLITPARESTRDLPVSVRTTGELPVGYQLDPGAPPSAEPAIVKVRGRADLVESVATVEQEVSLTGVREANYVAEGPLVARSASGNQLDVLIEPPRARATVKIEQTLSQRTVPILPVVTGTPAPGYRVVAISVDPPSLTVVGPKNVLDGIQSIGVERVDVTGARADVTQTKQVERLPNITVDRQTVVVKVEIKPIECGTGVGSPCGASTLYTATVIEGVPNGLRVEGVYTAVVRVAGPLPALGLLRPSDIRVVVSLANGRAGPNTVQPVATLTPSAPSGIVIEGVEPMTVTLIPAPPP
jgi:hypothetical protein